MQFRDLKTQYQILKSKIDLAMLQIANYCNFISGTQVTQYEKELCDTALLLPLHPYLSDEDIDRVCTVIEEGVR